MESWKIMTNQDKIVFLTGKWNEIVNLEHHKDCECHFYINEIYSYGEPPKYEVQYYGELYDDYEESDFQCFATHQEAERFLIYLLLDAVTKENKWALEVLKDKSFEQDQIDRAKRIVNICKDTTLDYIMFESKKVLEKIINKE